MQYPMPSINPVGPESNQPNVDKPLSWFEMTKLAVFKPGIQSFEKIADQTKFGKDPFLPVLLTVIISISIMLGLVFLIPGDYFSYISPSSSGIGLAISIMLMVICLLPLFVFTQLLGFYAFAGSNFIFAKMLGGNGGWKETLLTFSVIFIPLTFLSCVLCIIPYGGYVDIPIVIYFTILIVISIKAIHHINWFKCIAAVVIIPLVLLGGLAALMYFGLIRPYLPQVLEQLQQQYPGGFNV
jgi:hypothetical protein